VRRYKAEHETSLVAGVALGEGVSPELITGRTRDISAAGLSLSLPITDESQRTLITVGKNIRILLVLPTKTVHVRGDVVRSLSLGESIQLIGVEITQMEADDKAVYNKHLSSLR
jgi:hypothetical protein